MRQWFPLIIVLTLIAIAALFVVSISDTGRSGARPVRITPTPEGSAGVMRTTATLRTEAFDDERAAVMCIAPLGARVRIIGLREMEAGKFLFVRLMGEPDCQGWTPIDNVRYVF